MTDFEDWVAPKESKFPKIEYPRDANKTGTIQSQELKSFKNSSGNEDKKLSITIQLDGETVNKEHLMGKQKSREFALMTGKPTPEQWIGIRVRIIPYSISYDGKEYIKPGIIQA